ncbi:MAG: cytochrome c oxidase subunit II [Planctomycetes bacterium]|nr:cytochrome c oxidase subunit II [Planctomycetota bacterium]
MSSLKHFLLRAVITLLFLAVPILGVWTFVKAEEWGLWFPPTYSTYGPSIDFLFDVIMWMVAVTFVGTELLLVWFFFRYSKKDATRATYTHGNHTLEMVWTAIPALLLIFVAFSQMKAWSTVKINFPEDGPYTVAKPLMEIYASQFDWRVRYPDAQGNFEGADVIEVPYDITVPADTKVVLRLKSRDVLHSFFVPVFRLKQDAVPGMEIPVWFEATRPGDYDLICAELCGWGHYKMAGKIHVLPKDEFASWLAKQRENLYAKD